MAAQRTAQIRYDAGTLVIAASGRLELSEVEWDARIGAWRACASDWDRVAESLRADGWKVDARPAPRPLPGVATPILRPYQEAALRAWELAGRRGIVVLPTGAGKTHLALGAMARAAVRTICLVPTRVLLEQWQRQIAEVYAGPIAQCGDGRREIGPITVATFASAWRGAAALGDEFDLVIADEVHHFGGGTHDEILQMSAARFRLGLTATPPSAEALDRLGRLAGPVVFELGVGDLTGTWLAPFDHHVVRVGLDPDERRRHDAGWQLFRDAWARWMSAGGSGSWPDFVAEARRSEPGRRALEGRRAAAAIAQWPRAKLAWVGTLLARHAEARTLIFTSTAESAYAIAREHLVPAITAEIGRVERGAILEAFGRGELRAIVSARVLNEGFDVPDADVAIVVAGSQGVREHVQRIGRVLRPRPEKRAIVYELVTRASLEVRAARERRAPLARGASR